MTCRYVQVMGKDNVAFHTVNFIATLLGSGEPWKTVDMLKSFNWLNWYGGKFSTSQNRGVFMDQALELAARRRAGAGTCTANCAGGVGRGLHLGTVRRRAEQGPGRRAGQLRQPHPQVLPRPAFDGRVPEGGEDGPLELRKLHADLSAAGWPTSPRQMEAFEVRKSAQGAAGGLGAGQRVPDRGRALDRRSRPTATAPR